MEKFHYIWVRSCFCCCPNSLLLLFLCNSSFSFHFTRDVHGPPLCLLPQAPAGIGDAGDQREHPGGDPLLNGVLQLQPGSTRKIHPHLHPKELPQCHWTHPAGQLVLCCSAFSISRQKAMCANHFLDILSTDIGRGLLLLSIFDCCCQCTLSSTADLFFYFYIFVSLFFQGAASGLRSTFFILTIALWVMLDYEMVIDPMSLSCISE